MATAPLATSQDPAAFVRSLMQQFMQPTPEPDFSSFSDHVSALNQAASNIFSQLQQAAAQPAPQTNPTADFLTRATAAAGDVLTQRTSGLAGANEGIAKEQQMLRERRIQNLQLLIKAHENAADRAAKAGDALEEAKLRAKIESIHGQIEKQRGALEGASALLRAQNDQNQTAAENARAALSAGTQIKVAEIYADARKTGKLDELKAKDPVKGALFESYIKQAQEMEDRRSQLATKTDNKGRLVVGRDKKAMKELDALDARKLQLLQSAQDLFNPPAPTPGPLGTPGLSFTAAPAPYSAPPPASWQAPQVTAPQLTEDDILSNLITARGAASVADVQKFLRDPQLRQQLIARGLSIPRIQLLARQRFVQQR